MAQATASLHSTEKKQSPNFLYGKDTKVIALSVRAQTLDMAVTTKLQDLGE